MTPEKHDPGAYVERPLQGPPQALSGQPGPELPFEEKSVDALCRKCGDRFRAKQFKCMGSTFTSGICGVCSEKQERLEQEAAERQRQHAVTRSLKIRDETWLEWCPKEFRLTSEGGNTELGRLELAQPKVKELVQWKLGDPGWIIRGETGTCKTRSLWRLIRRLYLEGRTVRLLTAAQFDRECRDAAGSYSLTAWFNRLAQCDVFILDDLGNGAWTNATEATFFDLVDERGREGRAIFVTTQHTGDSLKQQSEDDTKKHLRAEALIRRLRAYCEPVVFT